MIENGIVASISKVLASHITQTFRQQCLYALTKISFNNERCQAKVAERALSLVLSIIEHEEQDFEIVGAACHTLHTLCYKNERIKEVVGTQGCVNVKRAFMRIECTKWREATNHILTAVYNLSKKNEQNKSVFWEDSIFCRKLKYVSHIQVFELKADKILALLRRF